MIFGLLQEAVDATRKAVRRTANFYDHKARASNGDPEEQYWLGDYYWSCNDIDECIWWFEKAAYKGHVRAQFKLGLVYDNGLYQSRDPHRDRMDALRYFRMAAEQGHADAQVALGRAMIRQSFTKEQKLESYAWLCLGLKGRESDNLCHWDLLHNAQNDLRCRLKHMSPEEEAELRTKAEELEEFVKSCPKAAIEYKYS